MTWNATGDVNTTLEKQMAAYDKLPAAVRSLLQQCREPWDTTHVLHQIKMGVSADAICAFLTEVERMEAAANAVATWGRDYLSIVLQR